jgi:Trypsin Inhibitor like cysteine rich domain
VSSIIPFAFFHQLIDDTFVAAECPANEVFHDCFQHKCERSCTNLKQPCAVGNICRTGCFCKDGYVRKGDTCVLPMHCDDCKINFIIFYTDLLKNLFAYRCLRRI